MPDDNAIKSEMLEALDESVRQDCVSELDTFATSEGLDGKSCLQKLYAQWKTGKKGNRNLHNSWLAFHL